MYALLYSSPSTSPWTNPVKISAYHSRLSPLAPIHMHALVSEMPATKTNFLYNICTFLNASMRCFIPFSGTSLPKNKIELPFPSPHFSLSSFASTTVGLFTPFGIKTVLCYISLEIFLYTPVEDNDFIYILAATSLSNFMYLLAKSPIWHAASRYHVSLQCRTRLPKNFGIHSMAHGPSA